jgi:hypothetical protein
MSTTDPDFLAAMQMMKEGKFSDTPQPAEVEEEESEDLQDKGDTPPPDAPESKDKGEDYDWRREYESSDEYKEELRKKDNAQYEAKLKEIEEIEKDEVYQIIKQARAEGKNPIDVLKEFASADYEKMSPSDLYKIKIERYKGRLTEEQVQESLEKFENMTAIEQLEATESIREQLIKESKEKLSVFAPKQSEPDPQVVEAVNKFKNDFNSLLNKLSGKTYKGVDYTPALLRKIEKAVIEDGLIHPRAYMNEDGTFDAMEALEAATALKPFRALVKGKEIKQEVSKALEDVLKERSNVSKGIKSTGMPRSSDSDADFKEALRQFKRTN